MVTDGGRRDEIRHAYNTVARDYAERFVDELSYKPGDRVLLDAAAARWKGAGPVVEVGCGPAHIGRYVADRGVDLWAIDLSPGMVEVARERNPGMRVEVADMAHLPCDDGSQAGALAFYSIFHVPRPEVPAVMAELARVLMPGGTLVASLHKGEGEVHGDDFLGHKVDLTGEMYSADEVRTLVTGAGLAIELLEVRDAYPEEASRFHHRIYLVAVKPG